MNIVAVDIGYGRIKLYNSKIKFSYPSYLVKYTPSDISFFATPDYIEVNDNKFYVGEDAYTMGKLIPLIGENFHGSNEWKALLSYALYRYFQEKGGYSDIDLLILGLPLNQYNEKRKQKIKSIKSITASVNDQSFNVKVKDVIVLPQGAGAVMLYQDKYDSMAIIDIGYYTIDLALFLDGKFVFNRSLSFNFGIHELYKNVAKKISKKFNYRPDYKKIEEIVKTKKIKIKGAEHKVDHIIDECKLNYCFDLVNMIKDEWEDSQKEAEKMLFIGGGAEVIKNMLPADPQFLVPENPAFANAIGYMKYAEEFLSDGKQTKDKKYVEKR
ncbi:ParM/StbA family protein [Deferribacter abyssi]|uniref:ParM/StbA family protein n=1 Tax=Deferribacter abyssi TaxID=213806 RepID=UPI003C161613